MSDQNLTLQKQLSASPEAVFDAWTTPESMAHWISPMTTAIVPKLDLRVGGEYQIDMYGDEKTHVHTGEYLEVDRPNRLVFSWFSEGTGQQKTIVTLEMEAKAGGTLLTLTHEHFPSKQSRDNHQKGWTVILDKLEGQMAKAASA